MIDAVKILLNLDDSAVIFLKKQQIIAIAILIILIYKIKLGGNSNQTSGNYKDRFIANKIIHTLKHNIIM